jgi:hypothetical protein
MKIIKNNLSKKKVIKKITKEINNLIINFE